jgi:hypothetical protein
MALSAENVTSAARSSALNALWPPDVETERSARLGLRRHWPSRRHPSSSSPNALVKLASDFLTIALASRADSSAVSG